MLPAVLHSHWDHIQIQLTDYAQRYGMDWPNLWQSLSAEQQQRAQKVLCISDYVVESLARDPWFSQALQNDSISAPLPRRVMSQWLDELCLDASSEEDWQSGLRKLRRRAMVQIIWRDLLRIASTLETTRALSDLADECIVRSIAFLSNMLQQRFGVPIGYQSGREQQLLVLGMGKLGAYELNLSSDVDLIFTYPESGETRGPKIITNQEYFVKLGQKLIQALDKMTVDGFVFRTDMRLRPYGASGPLVMNFASIEEYYQDQGRDWERYAMVKARIVNGEESRDARELLRILQAFTYRMYVDYSAFASLRSMKAMINAEVRRRGLDLNVKLGSGGIREVEFIVQAFQLIRGGQDKLLRTRELVTVLRILAGDGYLPQSACQELEKAYLFLRDSEHTLQALEDKQTQLLPDNDQEQARVALAMQCDDWQDYLYKLEAHRNRVRHHFAQIVAGDDDDTENDDDLQFWLNLWLDDFSSHDCDEFNQRFPNVSLDEIQLSLKKFRESRSTMTMQRIGRERLDVLMPLLLKELHDYPMPEKTLERITPLLEAVARRTAYLVLLTENPEGLTQLIKLCGASPWVAEYIKQTPLLLDELLNKHSLYRLPTRQELAEELHLRLLRIDEHDLEQQMEQLRQFVRAHKLRAAACEVMEALPLMKISDYLTWLAEVTVQTVLDLSWTQTVKKYGYPTNAEGEAVLQPEMIAIGYGKVGGLEMSYNSDLDMVLLHNCHSLGSTTGERSQDNPVFYARLGQRMIHILSTHTSSGDMYDVDMRLRPDGNSGMIVTSIKTFAEYQHKQAWTWEHQALVRARILCGSDAVAQEFEAVRRNVLSKERDLAKLREEVRAMRQKMVDNLGSKDTSGQQFHLKQDAGGIVDIEFLVQYGVLAWSHRFPELLDVTDNMRLLDAFDATGLMDSQDRITLQETYLSYRAETHRRALQKQSLLLDSETLTRLGFTARRNDVTRLWKLWLETDA